MCATAQQTARVLVVEDSQVQSALVRRAIHKVELLDLLYLASDGEETLAYLRNEQGFEAAQRPDVILFDLNMPKLNGFEVLDEVKQDDRLNTIPVIMFTTSDLDTDVTQAYKLGANTFISKPMNLDALTQTLENLARYWANARLAGD